MRHRAPQSIVSGGLTAGSPMSLLTRGLLQPRNLYKVDRVEKVGNTGGALDYVVHFSKRVDARSAEVVVGEYVDDLAVTGGTAV